MIKEDFTNYMDFRKGFFTLIKNIVFFATEGLFSSEGDHMKTFINSVIWAFKHDQPELAEIGLLTMSELISKVSFNTEICNSFMKVFYMMVLQDIFYVLTDGLHKGGFIHQAEVIMKLFSIVENNVVTEPFEENESGGSNKEYIQNYLTNALVQLFTNMNQVQIETYVINMFNRCNERENFMTTLRDLLVSLKEFAEDQDQLYQGEKEVSLCNF